MTQATFDPSGYDIEYVTFATESGESYNSKTDWKLLRAKFEISDPQLRKYEVMVPGRDGMLDLSDALGGAYFGNRSVKVSFLCLNWLEERFHLLASTMRNAIDGKTCRIVLSSDSSYFWRGRPQVVAEWDGSGASSLTVEAEVEPFKYSISSSYDPWVWDTFSFVNGVIVQEADVTLNNQTKTVTLPADRAGGKPVLWLSNGSVQAKLSTQQEWKSLESGRNTFPEITMDKEESVVLQLKGTGTVGIDYRLGSL